MGVTIHWLHPIDESVWLKPLQTELEKDEIRILSWRWLNPLSTQFALSTLPSASPLFIVQRLKGRLQYAVRDHADRLKQTQTAVLRTAVKRGCRVSRCSILADHLHVALGCELDCVPAELAFGMMNNIAYVYEMKPILLYSGFLGTFGEYDQRSVEGNRVGRL